METSKFNEIRGVYFVKDIQLILRNEAWQTPLQFILLEFVLNSLVLFVKNQFYIKLLYELIWNSSACDVKLHP